MSEVNGKVRVLKNKQKSYPPYLNPASAGFKFIQEYTKRINDRFDKIESGEIKVLNLMTQEEFETLCLNRRNAAQDQNL